MENPLGRSPNGKMNNEDYAEAEYGPKTGIWRILRMLDKVKVKTTFLTCGGIAERYPDAVKSNRWNRATKLPDMDIITRLHGTCLEKKKKMSLAAPRTC